VLSLTDLTSDISIEVAGKGIVKVTGRRYYWGRSGSRRKGPSWDFR